MLECKKIVFLEKVGKVGAFFHVSGIVGRQCKL